MEKIPQILYMTSFPPRECGIATFAMDLTRHMDIGLPPWNKSKILAMNNNGINIYNYPKEVIFQLNDVDIKEYIDVAKKINKIENIKLINIQHEFGLFGGKFGSYLINFLKEVDKPVIITFHSVLRNPTLKLKKIVQSLANRSACFIVMTEEAVNILRNEYDVKTDIVVIPHGIPSILFEKSAKEKVKKGLKNKIIISSFGLMNKNKGYEYVINAIPAVLEKFPNLIYLIIGETHPVVRKKEGEKYRNFLEKRVKHLGLQNNVKFYNKYLSLKEIISYLKATDIYISSGLDLNQITSGTLSYAMGCGRSVISTPFIHAIDMVSSDRGILVEPKNSELFSDAIIRLLSNNDLRESMANNAYFYTRNMMWSNVALAYKKLFDKYIEL